MVVIAVGVVVVLIGVVEVVLEEVVEGEAYLLSLFLAPQEVLWLTDHNRSTPHYYHHQCWRGYSHDTQLYNYIS